MYICPETDSPAGLWILAPPGSQEALFHLLSLVFQGDPVAQVTHFHPSRNTSKSSVKRIHGSKTTEWRTRAVKQRFHEVSGWQRRQRDKFSIHCSFPARHIGILSKLVPHSPSPPPIRRVPTFLQLDYKLREVKHHMPLAVALG